MFLPAMKNQEGVAVEPNEKFGEIKRWKKLIGFVCFVKENNTNAIFNCV